MTATVEEMIEHPMLVRVPLPEKLTARQVEVLTLTASGLSTKEVAARLEISEKTAEAHRAMIYKRLGIHDVASLTLYAVREGFVKVF